MARSRRIAALAAAGLSLGLGARSALERPAPEQRRPRWAAALARLAGAPLPTAAPVALLRPAGVPAATAGPLLLEAAWQRPDLRWDWFEAWREPIRPMFLVAVDAAPAPAGWTESWRREGIRVLRRGPP